MSAKPNTEVALSDTQTSATVAVITDKRLLAQLAEMVTMIPAETGNGTEDILRALLTATTWEDLNKPWQASDVSDLLGKKLQVTSVRRRPSSLAGGLGMFLVIKMYDPKTKKEYVKATGSVNIIGSFVWLFYRRATAITIEWHKAERPTEDGYYPQHIEIHDCHVPDQASA